MRLHQRLAVVEGALDRRRRARWARRAVVIMRRCTSEMRPCGKSTMASTRFEPRNASIAAPPVSPEVAADDGDALAAGCQHAVHQPRQQLHGHVLEGQRRPVEQLEHPQAAVDLHERRDGRVAEAGVGVARDARSARPAEWQPPANGSSSATATSANGLPAKAAMASGDELRPGLRHIEPAVARKPGQQRVLEGRAPALRLWC